jgi:hypothetical protein
MKDYQYLRCFMRIVMIKSKATSLPKWLIALALAGMLSIGLSAGSGHATVRATPPHAQASQSQTGQQGRFTGEISPNPDNGKDRTPPYVLYDENRKTDFYLDEERTNENLDNYIGKTVEITGTLDAKNDVIHIESIKAVN